MQPGGQRPLPDAVALGDLRRGLHKPVPADEYHPVLRGQGLQKIVQDPAQLFGIRLRIPVDSGDTLLQLLGQAYHLRPALGGGGLLQPVQRQIPADPGQIAVQLPGPGGGNGPPGAKIGVADALLSILPAAQDIVRKPQQPGAVGLLRPADGLLIPGKIKLDDGFIIHVGHLQICVLTL